jgi:hypothetical protein
VKFIKVKASKARARNDVLLPFIEYHTRQGHFEAVATTTVEAEAGATADGTSAGPRTKTSCETM